MNSTTQTQEALQAQAQLFVSAGAGIHAFCATGAPQPSATLVVLHVAHEEVLPLLVHATPREHAAKQERHRLFAWGLQQARGPLVLPHPLLHVRSTKARRLVPEAVRSPLRLRDTLRLSDVGLLLLSDVLRLGDVWLLGDVLRLSSVLGLSVLRLNIVHLWRRSSGALLGEGLWLWVVRSPVCRRVISWLCHHLVFLVFAKCRRDVDSTAATCS